MSLTTIIFIAIGLSMDAFAVSITRGMMVPRAAGESNSFAGKFFRNPLLVHALVFGLAFGFFQALMPQLGWLAGIGFKKLIMNCDHWIAFTLLGALGSKMLHDALNGGGEDEKKESLPLSMKLVLTLAIATSIDAMVAGLGFSALRVSIWLPVAIIGCVTFALSFAGVFIGRLSGNIFGNKIEILGGLILIGIGIKILVSHLC